MKHSRKKKIPALVLAGAMVLNLLGTVSAVKPEPNSLRYEKIDGSSVTADLFPKNQGVYEAGSNTWNADQVVRALVVLEDTAASREAQQEALAEEISATVLDGQELDVVWNLTGVTNAMAVNVPHGKLSEIRTLRNVKAAFPETRHDPLKASTDNALAQTMTGASGVRNSTGITGAGTRVAVIDTGSDTDHQSLNNDAYLLSLERLAAGKKMSLSDYMASLDLLSVEKIAQVLPQLNAAERYEDLRAEDLFYSEKLPFNFNYVDGSLDVTHDHDTQGSHGSHVAGIATANLLVPCEAADLDFNGDGKLDQKDVKALEDFVKPAKNAGKNSASKTIAHGQYADLSGDGVVTEEDAALLKAMLHSDFYATGAAKAVAVTGVAPDAQLITMKVFGQKGGAYASDYIAALEDAVLLGCDTANLSLGGNLSGFSKEISGWGREGDYEEMCYINGVMESLESSDLIACMSVGNSGNWADFDGGYGYLYTDEGGTFNASDPATFQNALAVASADNVGAVTTVKTVFGSKVEVAANASSNGVNDSWSSLDRDESDNGSTYQVAFLGDPSKLFAGQSQTDESIYGGKITQDLTGKVALIARGAVTESFPEGISFAEKLDNAAAAGAAAVLVYNNVDGVAYANLEGSTATIPFATITLAEAKAIYALGSANEMTVTSGLFVGQVGNAKYPTMSDFSSWGPTGALTLKPEITAPGGGIYSIDGVDRSGKGYEVMSGTSMSSPHVAGLSALVKQYIEESGLLEKAQKTGADVSARSLGQSLLMSTATPLVEEASGVEYSVRNQGAGLANLQALVGAQSFVMVDGQPDGKVKAELGDGTDGYSFTFTVYNTSKKTQHYRIDASILTTATRTQDGHHLIDDAMQTLKAKVDMPRSIQVPAGGSRTVTVRIRLSDVEVKKMEALGYTNGFYVEGFLYVTGKDVTHSIPMLGWYGNWGAPSMYDTGSYMDHIYGTAERPSHVINESGYKNMLGWASPNGQDVYPYDGNIYSLNGRDGSHQGDSHYNPDRNAFNSTGEKTYFPAVIFPTMIRNAEAFKIEFINHETGEVFYSENNYEHYWGLPLYSSSYIPTAGQWLDVTTEQGLDLAGWDYTDSSGNPLPEGTLVDFTLTTAPEYFVHHDEANQEVTVDWDALGDNARLSYTFRVDNTAPALADMDAPITLEGNTLTIHAQDENYIAAMVLLEGSGQMAYQFYYPDMDQKGAVCTQSMDLTEFRQVYGEKAVVVLCDYAGNQTYYALNLGGEGAAYGDFVAFQYNFDTGYNAWISFSRDVQANETTLFASDVEIVCAEYVGGYIFAQAADGKLYGIPYADMLANTVDLEKTYVATLENVYQDLTYNYKDGTLYGLQVETDPYDYDWPTSMGYAININGEYDSEDGWTHYAPYQEDWVFSRGGLYALCMASDDDGTIYLLGPNYDDDNLKIGDSGSLWKVIAQDDGWGGIRWRTYEIGDTGVTMDYLQSMTWDHNTETLNWARFKPVTTMKLACELYEIDAETAEATKLGDLTSETCALIAPLSAEAAAKPEHQNLPDMDSNQVATPVLRDKNVTMNVGNTRKFLYDLDPWYSVHKDVIWSSDNEAVATVDSEGVVTAVSGGTVHITAANKDDPSKCDSCTVNVSALDLEFEGIISAMGPGIGNTYGDQTYRFTMEKGVPKLDGGQPIHADSELDFGLSMATSAFGRGSIWTSEYGNTGMVYEIDPDTGKVIQALEPLDGEMLFGLDYSEELDAFAAIMNMYLFPDVPFDEHHKENVLNSYDDNRKEFMYHRLDLLPYLLDAGEGFVTGETNNGASSEIVLCGVTYMDDTDYVHEDNYQDFLGNMQWSGPVNYAADTTLVLLDNVGRLWYVDEITGMELAMDYDYGTMVYTRADGSVISPSRNGVLALQEDGKETYNVFYIREIQESPLTDLFRTGDMPRITYHFSDIQYGGRSEEGDPIFFLSLYDYWNNGITNELYMYIPGHDTDELDTTTWEPIRTPDLLVNLGDTGKYNIIATIHSAKYLGGLVTSQAPAATPLAVKPYGAK